MSLNRQHILCTTESLLPWNTIMAPQLFKHNQKFHCPTTTAPPFLVTIFFRGLLHYLLHTPSINKQITASLVLTTFKLLNLFPFFQLIVRFVLSTISLMAVGENKRGLQGKPRASPGFETRTKNYFWTTTYVYVADCNFKSCWSVQQICCTCTSLSCDKLCNLHVEEKIGC